MMTWFQDREKVSSFELEVSRLGVSSFELEVSSFEFNSFELGTFN